MNKKQPIFKNYSKKQQEHLYLPNVRFYEWCHKEFKINKGIYNTIDEHFYEYGISDLFFRRLYLLTFLEFVSHAIPKSNTKKFIQFGNGGLSRKLDQFMQELNRSTKEIK